MNSGEHKLCEKTILTELHCSIGCHHFRLLSSHPAPPSLLCPPKARPDDYIWLDKSVSSLIDTYLQRIMWQGQGTVRFRMNLGSAGETRAEKMSTGLLLILYVIKHSIGIGIH